MTRNKARTKIVASDRGIHLDGAKLRELRNLLNVPNRPSKGAFGVSYRSLSAYENMARIPPLSTVVSIFESMRNHARLLDHKANDQQQVLEGTSFLARVQAGQRSIIENVLEQEKEPGIAGDVEWIRRLLATLDDQTSEGQALRDSFIGNAEAANLRLDAEVIASRRRLADLLSAQGRNWLRNSRFVEAAKSFRESFLFASPTLSDRLALVRALLHLSSRPDDEAGREIASLHSAFDCKPNTNDWIDLNVSLGKTAFHYRDFNGAETALRRALEANVDDSARIAETLGHLAVVLYQQAEAESPSSQQREEKQLFACQCWERALTHLPAERFPHQHAVTQMRLGNFWSQKPSKTTQEKKTNLTNAYTHYETARCIWERLHVASYLGIIEYTIADWALKRSRVCERKSDRLRQLEDSVRLSRNSIEKLTPQASDDWHCAHFNLGEALKEQDEERPNDEFLQSAIAAYQIAADVYAETPLIDYWKDTMLPLCEVKARLALRNPSNEVYREQLEQSLRSLESKCSLMVDQHNLRKRIGEWRKKISQ
jgi:hypothetical protein